MAPTCTIAIANQKGGVGKTTLTFNLGWLLADRGRKVLAIDLDHQRNLTKGWGVDDTAIQGRTVYDVLCWKIPASEAVTMVGNHGLIPGSPEMNQLEMAIGGKQRREERLSRALADLLARDHYDYVLIDCPPLLGLATLNALYAATNVLIPVQPEQWPIESTIDFFQNLDELRSDYHSKLNILGVVPNLCEKATNQHQQGLQYLAELTAAWGIELFRPISKTTRMRDAASARQALPHFDRSTDATLALIDIAERIDERFVGSAEPVTT